jgi:phosphotransferase system  glucose/maltose/N-acetylglucosamine-specific IIC component
MFESVAEDPGEGALRRAARIFYVLAVLGAIGAVLLSVLALSAGAFGALTFIRLVLYLALAGLSWITGRGIDDQKPWARTVGIVLGLLELLNFPIGTVIGVVILIYLNRASRAGLFASASSQRVSG